MKLACAICFAWPAMHACYLQIQFGHLLVMRNHMSHEAEKLALS